VLKILYAGSPAVSATVLENLIARINEIGYLPEGAVACKYVQEISRRLNIRLPICNGLYRILNKEIKPLDFLIELLR